LDYEHWLVHPIYIYEVSIFADDISNKMELELNFGANVDNSGVYVFGLKQGDLTQKFDNSGSPGVGLISEIV